MTGIVLVCALIIGENLRFGKEIKKGYFLACYINGREIISQEQRKEVKSTLVKYYSGFAKKRRSKILIDVKSQLR